MTTQAYTVLKTFSLRNQLVQPGDTLELTELEARQCVQFGMVTAVSAGEALAQAFLEDAITDSAAPAKAIKN